MPTILASISKTPTPTITPIGTPSCTPAWEVVSSPNPDQGVNVLYGVSAIASNNLWAVGSYAGNTMMLHWAGNQWTRISSPNRPNEDHLLGVTAISSNDVWAVGWSHDPNTGWFTLTEHWDGTQWSIIPSANTDAVENYLQAVSGVSSDDIWAVGYYIGDSAFQTLVEHWDGTQWSIVSSPNVNANNNELYSVSAISANDAWAAGYYSGGANGSNLVEHWDGTQWTVVASPSPPNVQGSPFHSIHATSTNDVWAAGGYTVHAGVSSTLIEHWNGGQWSIVPSPDFGAGFNTLQAITATSSTDAWAVGYYSGNNGASIIEHWDGQQWSLVPHSDPSTNDNLLEAVEALSSTDIWAVGWWDTCLGCPVLTLTENYSAHCSSPSPVPSSSPLATTSPSTSSPTSTPGVSLSPTIIGTVTESLNSTHTPTATDTASSTVGAVVTTSITGTLTATVTTTSTACPIQFTDVPPSSTFYTYIRCMACRGIIGGYSSGCGTGNLCFRPNNNVTRGQLSKIISNSAGFNDTPTGQTFDDVSPGSTFYAYIERMASRGIIGGYPCGGAGEPCDDQHRPYFRSNSNATRGQIAKIDVLAAVQTLGWPLLNPPDSTFEDVAAGTTFYQYVETAYAHNVINGYACGTPPAGECMPPGNKPYFLPGANATRGQTSKIVANTFFPDCQTP